MLSTPQAFDIGSRIRVTAGPHVGRTGVVLGSREVIASGAAANLAADASTQTTNWLYDMRFDGVGEMGTMSHTVLEPCG